MVFVCAKASCNSKEEENDKKKYTRRTKMKAKKRAKNLNVATIKEAERKITYFAIHFSKW